MYQIFYVFFRSLSVNIVYHRISYMGQARTVAESSKITHSGQNQKLIYAATSMCGWRLYMQDADVVECPLGNTDMSLFAVFDGHGGAQVSKFAKLHFVQELLNNQNFIAKKYEIALKQTFLLMDRLMLSQKGKAQLIAIHKQMIEKQNAPADQEYAEAGCTANVVLITPTQIYCANSGDSRAVASINKRTEPLSYDHKPQDQIEIDRITKAGGQITWGRVNGNLNLTRALGDFEYKRSAQLSQEEQMITANPDIKKIKNQNIDFIIMGCDGIWEVKSNEQMVELISKKLDSKKQMTSIVEQLLDELVSKNGGNQYGMDNMSTILIKFK